MSSDYFNGAYFLLRILCYTALGKHLVAAGRRYQSLGLYGPGEFQKIANAMTKAGKLLASLQVSRATDELRSETRTFKLGELQVVFTADKASTGAAIAIVFGIVSWELTCGIQNVPDSSLQYANDNVLLLAKAQAGYSSTFLSVFASVGLLYLEYNLNQRPVRRIMSYEALCHLANWSGSIMLESIYVQPCLLTSMSVAT